MKSSVVRKKGRRVIESDDEDEVETEVTQSKEVEEEENVPMETDQSEEKSEKEESSTADDVSIEI